MFNSLFLEAGKIPVKELYKFEFKYLGSGEHVKQSDGRDSSYMGCSCSDTKYDHKTKVFTISYTPKNVPFHIKNKKENTYKYHNATNIVFKENGMNKVYTLQIVAYPYDDSIKF